MRDTLAIFSLALLFFLALGEAPVDRQAQAVAPASTTTDAVSAL